MSQLRVISPILHDQVRYEVGDLMDPSILSEGQADALIEAGALEVVNDEPEAETEQPAVVAEPAPVVEAAPVAEPAEAPAAEVEETEEPEQAAASETAPEA